MKQDRRIFSAALLPAVLALSAGKDILASVLIQRERLPRPPQEPEPPFKPDSRVLLKQNQQDLKRDVLRLAELVEQLKAEVEKTDAADVLSLSLVRRAEEIEKLARKIKDRARG